MRDSDSTSNNSDADDEGSSDGTHFEWDADATPTQPGPSGVGAGSARTDGRRNPAVRALLFDTNSEEGDGDDASQHQQMEVADVHNEPLSPDNQPTDEPSDNEEPPVSPNLINAEDHEMANLEMEAVENERDFILETLSRHVEPGEAVHRAFLSVPPAHELSGIDIANAVKNRYRIMSNFYHGDPDATYDNNFNPWDEVHLRINERS